MILGAAWILLFALERVVPLRKPRSALSNRLVVNGCVSALAVGTAYLVVMPAASTALQHVAVQQFGLLQWIRLSPAVAIVAGIALLDLSFYYWHMANHRIPWLWRVPTIPPIHSGLDLSSPLSFPF